jgi:hypothetical protein
MGLGACDILGIEALVEADRGVDLLHDLGRFLAEPSAPHPVGHAVVSAIWEGHGISVVCRIESHEQQIHHRIQPWRAGLVALGLVCSSSGATASMPGRGAQAPDAAAVAGGDPPDRVTRELATGTLTAFVVHPEPKPVAEISFVDAEQTPCRSPSGRAASCWSTCGPPGAGRAARRCRNWPSCSAAGLGGLRGGGDQRRPPGRRGRPAVPRERRRRGADALSRPEHQGAGRFKAVGLPASILIDRSGREIGRMFGPADWASPEAVRLIETAIAAGGTS